jgi:hypothetical protein
MTTSIALQLFSAARCFRSEFRREIFAFAATICSARDGLFRGARLFGFASVPADGMSGSVGCIESN